MIVVLCSCPIKLKAGVLPRRFIVTTQTRMTTNNGDNKQEERKQTGSGCGLDGVLFAAHIQIDVASATVCTRQKHHRLHAKVV